MSTKTRPVVPIQIPWSKSEWSSLNLRRLEVGPLTAFIGKWQEQLTLAQTDAAATELVAASILVLGASLRLDFDPFAAIARSTPQAREGATLTAQLLLAGTIPSNSPGSALAQRQNLVRIVLGSARTCLGLEGFTPVRKVELGLAALLLVDAKIPQPTKADQVTIAEVQSQVVRAALATIEADYGSTLQA